MFPLNITRSIAITSLICILIFVLPLAFINIVLGIFHPGKCDYTDILGFNVAQYLLGLGISNLIISFALIILYTMFIYKIKSCTNFMRISLIVIIITNNLFGMAWFIIGGIILFRGNLECIRNGSSLIIYALVIWCISALNTIYICCNHIKGNDNDND